VTWITFHGCFDFGYLMKSVMYESLPDDHEDFLRYHRIYFPRSYDLKAIVNHPRFINYIAPLKRIGLQEVGVHGLNVLLALTPTTPYSDSRPAGSAENRTKSPGGIGLSAHCDDVLQAA